MVQEQGQDQMPVFEWTVYDVCCGLGGASLGIIDAFAEHGVKNAKFVGIEMVPAVAHAYKKGIEAHCKSIGVDYEISVYAAEFGKDLVEFPTESAETGKIFFHASPPCQMFSSARVGCASKEDHDKASQLFRLTLQTIEDKGYKYWTLENVPKTKMFVDEFHYKNHTLFARGADCIFEAQKYGCPSDRKRLIASSPRINSLMRSVNEVAAVNIRTAMEAHELPIPASCVSNGNKHNGKLSTRSVHTTAPTLTASHALSWVTVNGDLLRCLNKTESAALLGFPKDFTLPKGNRDSTHALGNAVSPVQSRMMARAVLEASRTEPAQAAGGESDREGKEGDSLEACLVEIERVSKRMRMLM